MAQNEQSQAAEAHQKERDVLFASEAFAIGVLQVVSGGSLFAVVAQPEPLIRLVGKLSFMAFLSLMDIALVLAVLAAFWKHQYKKWDVKAGVSTSGDAASEAHQRNRKAQANLNLMRWAMTVAVCSVVLGFGLLLLGAILAWLGILNAPAESHGHTLVPATAIFESSTFSQSSIPSLITAGATLTGVLVGSIATYIIQAGFHRRDRQERHCERIREAYANWAGALLGEVHAQRNLLSFQESMQAGPPDQIAAAIASNVFDSAKEMSIALLHATNNEQVTFARLQLTDLDDDRLHEAHEIRLPVKTYVPDSQETIARSISKFSEIENTFVNRLSKFIAAIAKSLEGK